MSQFAAQPIVEVEIYPYEGGPSAFVISSSQGTLLEATVSKRIHSSQPGSFTLTLAPGGPGGVTAVRTWAEICTPMSLVVLKGSRWTHNNVIMIGVVDTATESQEWDAGRKVTRITTIQGYDFQYYYTQFSYYTLYFLGTTAASALSETVGAAALPALNNQGLLHGTPEQVGAAWFNHIMAGKDGILADTVVRYKNKPIAFGSLMGQYYQSLIADGEFDFIIPMAENFLSSEGSWWDKFSRIFPMPWYEFFVITAQNDFYKTSATASTMFSVESADPIQAFQQKYSPQMVARVVPIPRLKYNQQTQKYTVDTALWDALPSFQLDGHGFIDSNISFDCNEARNFYVISPITLYTITGQSSNSINPYLFTLDCVVDVGSIHRYGFRPQIDTTYWLADPKGQAAQANTANSGNYEQMISSLLLRSVSWYEPTPLMARATVTMEFRPDIMPGCKFVYAPFKNGELWEFYIIGYEHHYVFGEATTTTLYLERGLPKYIYDRQDSVSVTVGGNNASGAFNGASLLTAILGGYAMRQGSSTKSQLYQVGLPPEVKGQGIEFLKPQSAYPIMGQIAKIFTTPQAN